jgi:hypothetical protein
VCQRFIEYVAGRGMEEEIRMEGESERLELVALPRGGFRCGGSRTGEFSGSSILISFTLCQLSLLSLPWHINALVTCCSIHPTITLASAAFSFSVSTTILDLTI